MGGLIPSLSRAEFDDRLQASSPERLTERIVDQLYAHFLELRRWNAALSLIGPGSAAEIVERHYGESLAALPLVHPQGTLVDVGSGAGFPGFVLAAARPGLAVTLVEARGKKCVFLQAAARRAALSCGCLNARVAAPLPAGFPAAIDLVTVRALKPSSDWIAPLLPFLTPTARFLFWTTEEPGALLPDFETRRQIPIPGRSRSRIVEMSRELS